MIQRLARLLVQDLERGPVVGKRGKTDGNRNRTRHILMRDGRRTYPGSRLSADSFPTMPGITKTNSPPPMREAISASPSCSCRTAPIRLRTTSPALWPNVSLMPLKSSMSMMPRKKALSPAKTGFSLLTRALRVSRPVSPSCSALRFKSLCAKRNRLVSVSRWRPVKKSLYPQTVVEIMGAKAGDAEHGYMDRVEPCQGWGLRMKSDEDMQKATGLRDNNHPPEPFGQKLRRGGKHDGENDAHAVRVRRVASIPSIWMPASSITGYGPCYAGLHVLQQRPPPHTLCSLPDKTYFPPDKIPNGVAHKKSTTLRRYPVHPA